MSFICTVWTFWGAISNITRCLLRSLSALPRASWIYARGICASVNLCQVKWCQCELVWGLANPAWLWISQFLRYEIELVLRAVYMGAPEDIIHHLHKCHQNWHHSNQLPKLESEPDDEAGATIRSRIRDLVPNGTKVPKWSQKSPDFASKSQISDSTFRCCWKEEAHSSKSLLCPI